MYDLSQEKDRKIIDLLVAEKNQRVGEMYEYNKRQDKTMSIYLSGLYAAIGLGVADKLNLDIGEKLLYVPIAFSFVFLNLCLLLHAISQGLWTFSLAKYVHHVVDPRLEAVIFPREEINKPFSKNWDDWDWEIKGAANTTRGVVFFLWCILVHAVSFTAFKLVNIRGFYESSPVTTVIGFSILFVFLVYIWICLAEFCLQTNNFHKNPGNIIDDSDEVRLQQSGIKLRARVIGCFIALAIAGLVKFGLSWYV